MSYLVIVESPAKATTIKGYLGPNYKVIASRGHIRDLPKSTLGIDIESGFVPHYINIRGKGDIIKELKKEAQKASKVFLATDPDREGEAISWHIATELGIAPEKASRITFNEITKGAVKEAIKNPRPINMDLVNSQQARRILDRIVGFKLSQLLWKNVKSGLSGGRVQSVAARIITEREEEIRSFVPQEYWTVDVKFENAPGEFFETRFFGDASGKIRIENKAQADEILAKIREGQFCVSSVKHLQRQKMPAPPFTTSTLQQEASKKLGFQAQKIMKVAQELYDGLNLGPEFGGVQGLITYMRTDSLRIADSARESASEFIREHYGEAYTPKNPRQFKANSNAQDAHEAIRPANVYITPKKIRKLISLDQYKLYKLIWERFVASQMEAAILDTVSIDVENNSYIFRTSGYTVKFAGYMELYNTDDDENMAQETNFAKLPAILDGEILQANEIKSEQHFTEPPARYTEASLVKFLEENGIGRPSTYAPIISIILSRNYVARDGKSLVGTSLGEVTTKYMSEYFPEIVDYEFTAYMEEQLDSIENQKTTTHKVLDTFYERFKVELERAADCSFKEKVENPVEESDVICDKCGARMIFKEGKFGKFLACPSYPACRNTKAVDKNGQVVERETPSVVYADFDCEICGGRMVIRNGKFGEFYACSNYPQCKFTKQKITKTGVPCPHCAADIIARRGKGKTLFFSCEKYPECDFSSWDMPLNEKCPDCGAMLYYRKSRKAVICKEKKCSYKREEEIEMTE